MKEIFKKFNEKISDDLKDKLSLFIANSNLNEPRRIELSNLLKKAYEEGRNSKEK